MFSDELYQIATQSVDEYESQWEQWKADHEDLKECWACEDWLESGLTSYKGLCYLDSNLALGAKLGRIDLTHNIQIGLISLFERWLAPAEDAGAWIASLTKRGQKPNFSDEINEAIAAVKQLVTERKARLERINSVNSAMLRRLAKTHRPPDSWFDGQD